MLILKDYEKSLANQNKQNVSNSNAGLGGAIQRKLSSTSTSGNTVASTASKLSGNNVLQNNSTQQVTQQQPQQQATTTSSQNTSQFSDEVLRGWNPFANKKPVEDPSLRPWTPRTDFHEVRRAIDDRWNTKFNFSDPLMSQQMDMKNVPASLRGMIPNYSDWEMQNFEGMTWGDYTRDFMKRGAEQEWIDYNLDNGFYKRPNLPASSGTSGQPSPVSNVDQYVANMRSQYQPAFNSTQQAQPQAPNQQLYQAPSPTNQATIGGAQPAANQDAYLQSLLRLLLLQQQGGNGLWLQQR